LVSGLGIFCGSQIPQAFMKLQKLFFQSFQNFKKAQKNQAFNQAL
jgi:hypothetical protein